MPLVLVYLLKISLSLAVVYAFYHFALRKLTFYKWNRFYLLGYSALSFLAPFIDVSVMLEQQHWENSGLVQWVPLIGNELAATGMIQNDPVTTFNPWFLLSFFLLSGMLLMLVRLLIQWISFRRMLRNAELLEDGKMKIYKVEGDIIPFSFGNSIFINPSLHSTPELQEIIRHEFVHVKQKHSLDIIWGEFLCLLNWYNPFAWMIRAAIRQNLEFIADQQVLDHGTDRKKYQYLLLKVIGNDQFSIASKFNFSSLKKRIAMMNKMRSAGPHLFKFLFILPLAAVMLLAFRNNQEPQTEKPAQLLENWFTPVNISDTVAPITKTIPPAPPAPTSNAAFASASSPAPIPPFAIVSAPCKPEPPKKNGSLVTFDSPAPPIALAGNASTDPRSYFISGKEDIVISISPSTTKQQLDDLIVKMKDKGVELKFDNLNFNDGKLVSISGSMKKGGSISNFTANDFKKLTLAMVEIDGRIHFKVSTGNEDDKC